MTSTKNTVFVGNIPFTTTQDQLQSIFGSFGQITEVKIPTNRETGKSRGFAFVTFESEDSANQSLSVDGTDCGGRAIRVSLANGKREDRPIRPGSSSSPRFGSDRGGGGFGRSDRGNGGFSGGNFRNDRSDRRRSF